MVGAKKIENNNRRARKDVGAVSLVSRETSTQCRGEGGYLIFFPEDVAAAAAVAVRFMRLFRASPRWGLVGVLVTRCQMSRIKTAPVSKK